MNTFLFSLLTGVVSGLIASFVFFVVFFKIRPKGIFSDQVCIDPEDGLGRIKLVNLTKSDLVDVKYVLHYYQRYSDDLATISEIKPDKSPISFVRAFSKNDKNMDYAVRLSYPVSGYTLNEDSFLRFTFYARHSFTGSSIIYEKDFFRGSFQCGHFQTGEKTSVLPSRCGSRNDVLLCCFGEDGSFREERSCKS